MNKLIGLILLLIGVNAFASAPAVYIAATAAPGANGSSCASAYSPAFFNTPGSWGSASNQIGPGTVVHLCGTFTGTVNETLLSFQGSGLPGSPITLYFEPNAKLTNPAYWNDYSGAIVSDGHNNIVVDGGTNGLIENTGNGSGLAYQHDTKGLVIRSCSANCVVKNLSVNNMYVHIPGTQQGVASGEDGPSPNGTATGIECSNCSNSTLGPNNKAHDDFAGIVHNWSNTVDSNVTITGNTVTRCNWGIEAAGTAGGSTNEVISHNDISDAYPWDDGLDGNHHNGIMVFETGPASTIKNLQEYSNYIHGNFSNLRPASDPRLCHTTAWIFNDYNGGTWLSPMIFNNLLVNTNPNCGPGNGFLTPVANGGTTGLAFNNTFVGIGTALSVTGTWSFKNNLVYQTDLGLSNEYGTIASSDYNLYYNLMGANQAPSAVMYDHSSLGFVSTIAQWIANSPYDKNSQTANPNLSSTYALTSASTSAIGKAANLSSFCSVAPALCKDYSGKQRPSSGAWDIGAFQYGSSAPVSSPSPTPVPAPSPSPSTSSAGLYRINSGGPALVDHSGRFTSADELFSGGLVSAGTTMNIANCLTPAIYQSARYGNFSYTLPVPNGARSVTLRFAEFVFGASGQRVFNVKINGVQVLTNFDIFAAAGGEYKAIDKAFNVNVTNGIVNIEFTSVVNNAIVSGITLK